MTDDPTRLAPLPGMTVLRDLTLVEMQQAMLGLTTPRAAVAALDAVDRHWLRVPTAGVDLTGRTERDADGGLERVTLDVQMPSGWSVRVMGPWTEVDR